MSNQDLINQLEADIVRLNGLITNDQTSIDNCNDAIVAYQSSITALNSQIDDLNADITDLNQQIINDNLIIAFIPPDTKA